MATTETYYPYGSSYDPTLPPGQAPIVRRISWGAVFAGVVVALSIQLLLGMLGVAVGAGVIDPYGNGPSAEGIGIGAGIWLLLSTLIGLFFGGWVAGRLSGLPRGIEPSLHGILTWGMATFALFFILTTAVGAVVGGVFNILGAGLNVAGKGAGEAISAVAGNVNVDSARNDLMAMLNPDSDESRRRGGMDLGADLAKDSAFRATTSRIIQSGKDSVDQNDRSELVNILVTRHQMTYDEANRRVNDWATKYRDAKARIDRTAQQVGSTARDVADKTASGVSQAATWTFVMMMLGGIAAAIGGLVSRPKSTRPGGVDDDDRPRTRTTATRDPV